MLVGLGIMFFSVKDYRRALVSATWEETAATATRDSREGLMGFYRGKYIYYADGQTYEGRKVRFFVNNRLFNPGPGKSFQAGDEFAIYVHPEQPDIAVVVTGASGVGFAIVLVAGLVTCFFGAGGLVQSLSGSKGQEPGSYEEPR